MHGSTEETTKLFRIKVCGITVTEDAQAVAAAGADAIGLNWVAGPRKIDAEAGAAILATLPARCTPVALVRVEDGAIHAPLLAMLESRRVRWLQLYGDVEAPALRQLQARGFATILVASIDGDDAMAEVASRLAAFGEHGPEAVLLDARHRDQLGGTGQTFDWSILQQARQRGALDDFPPIVLAGGLNPDNVAEAIRVAAPAAVDVSSGVEASPGRKDTARVSAFVSAARKAFTR